MGLRSHSQDKNDAVMRIAERMSLPHRFYFGCWGSALKVGPRSAAAV